MSPSGWTRRRLLGAVAGTATVATAGCTARRESGTPDGTTTGTTTERTTTTTAGSRALSVGETATVPNASGREETGEVTPKRVAGRRQYALGRLRTGSTVEVEGERDRAYLFASVGTSWGEQSTDCIVPGNSFARLVLDGEEYGLTEPCAYDYDVDDDGQLLFGVPPGVEADRGRMEWVADGGTVAAWRLPGEVLSWLEAPADFRVREVGVPDSAPEGEYVTVSVTVENVGGHGGRFLFGVQSSAVSHSGGPADVYVPAGETVTGETSVRAGERIDVGWGWDGRSVSMTVTGG